MSPKIRLAFSLILIALLFLAGFSLAQHPRYDFIISGAHVVDGTGAPWFAADIGILGDRIAAIGDLSKASAAKRLDAAGLVVSPGFIDLQGQSEFNILVDNRAASRVGLLDRGILRPGMIADITVFDPKTVKDVATYNDPLHYSLGVMFVFVNGRPVLWEGRITEERPGRALRGPGYKPGP